MDCRARKKEYLLKKKASQARQRRAAIENHSSLSGSLFRLREIEPSSKMRLEPRGSPNTILSVPCEGANGPNRESCHKILHIAAGSNAPRLCQSCMAYQAGPIKNLEGWNSPSSVACPGANGPNEKLCHKIVNTVSSSDTAALCSSCVDYANNAKGKGLTVSYSTNCPGANGPNKEACLKKVDIARPSDKPGLCASCASRWNIEKATEERTEETKRERLNRL